MNGHLPFLVHVLKRSSLEVVLQDSEKRIKILLIMLSSNRYSYVGSYLHVYQQIAIFTVITHPGDEQNI